MLTQKGFLGRGVGKNADILGIKFFFFFELEKLIFSYQREEGREIGIKGFKYVVMEKNLTLGCKHAMQCVYDLLSNCTLETY